MAGKSPTIFGIELPFAESEYRARIDKARESLTAARLDALLMFHQESMYYLFGYDQLGYWVYQTAILPADGRGVTVVCRTVDNDFIAGLPHVDDIVHWLDDSPNDPTQITVQTLHKMQLLGPGKRVGIELRSHALLAYYYEGLRRRLDSWCDLVDASDLIAELRLNKSAAEIAYTRRAAVALDAGYSAAFAAIRPGVREVDILAEALRGMLTAGGEAATGLWPPLASGPRTLARTHGNATDRVVQDEEMVQLELGGCYRRYHTVGVQSKWLGVPPAEVRDDYDRMNEARLVALEHVRPGVPVAEVARRANAILQRAGLRGVAQHLGYGTGIGYVPTWVDNLRIKEHDPHILEPNWVFFLVFWHTTVLDTGPVEVFLGEPILVTESGFEHLSSIPLSLELDI